MEPTNEQYIEQQIRQRFSDLTEDQFERVKEMAVSHSLKNQGRLPSIEGIVRLVRSQPERPTPNTSESNGEGTATGGTFVGQAGTRDESFSSATWQAPAAQAGCGLKASALEDFNSKVVVGKEGFKQSILDSLGSAASFFTKK